MRKIGTAHTRTDLYKGNGSSGYLRGSSVSVTKQGSKIPYTLYISTGGTYRALGQSGYYAGSSETYYKGDGGYIYGRGTRVYGIEYSGTLYEAGDSVTAIGSPVYNAYQRNAEDDETFSEIGSACSLKLATFSTRNVTALTT